MSDKVYHLIQKEHLARLRYLNESNPKIVVLFSGGNAVGKSSLAQFLADQLKALVLNNDEVRHVIASLYPHVSKEEKNQTMWDYTLKLYKNLSILTTNGLVVRDAVIDWQHEQLLPLFSKMGYQLYFVWFSLSDEFNVSLIEGRGDTSMVTVQRFKELLPLHRQKQAEFRKDRIANIEVTDDTFGNWQRVADDLAQNISRLA